MIKIIIIITTAAQSSLLKKSVECSVKRMSVYIIILL